MTSSSMPIAADAASAKPATVPNDYRWLGWLGDYRGDVHVLAGRDLE
jgi:hypothetical protein